jgi:hypothetical protein
VLHQLIEKRSLALHRLVAQRILEQPELFDVVKTNIARWKSRLIPQESQYFNTWQNAVNSGIDAALLIACEDSRKAADMRQSSPFASILSPEERKSFLRKWKESHAQN